MHLCRRGLAGSNRRGMGKDFRGARARWNWLDRDGLPCACAFVVRTDEAREDLDLEQALRELARAALPRYKQPRRYIFVSQLPYTATGKIQRFKLRERLKESSLPSSRLLKN